MQLSGNSLTGKHEHGLWIGELPLFPIGMASTCLSQPPRRSIREVKSTYTRRWPILSLLLLVLFLPPSTRGASFSPPASSPAPNTTAGAFQPKPATAWREVWNAQGTLYAAALAPDDPTHVLWAVGDGGRLMRTSDGGTFWRFSRLPGRPVLHALVLADRKTGLAAGTGGKLYRTEDGGDTWSFLSAPTGEDIHTLDASGSRIWLGAENGLFLSRDKGLSWTRLLTSTITAWSRQGNTWVAGTADGHLYVSFDEGASWQSPTLGTVPIHALLVDETSLYAAGANGLLKHSQDQGTSWTGMNIGTSDDLQTLARAADGSIWAAGENGHAYRLVGSAIISTTVDVEGRTLYALASAPDNTLWALGDGPDIWRSKDKGASWTLVNGGRLVRLRAVTFVDERRGWAVGEQERSFENRKNNNAVVLHTEDGGESWQMQSLPAEPPESYGWLNDISCTDGEHCWTVGRNAIFHTVDGGANWERQHPGLSDWFYTVLFPSPATGFVGGSAGLILKTVNGGKAWKNISSPTNHLPLHKLSALDENNVAAALDQGYLLYSHSGGRFWGRTWATLPRHLRGIDWTDSTHIWVTGVQGYLAVFDPSTATWSYKEGGTKSYDWWGLKFAPDRKRGFRAGGYCAGYDREDSCLQYTGGLLAITFNRGKSWKYYETSTPGTLRDVSVLSENRAWAVGDGGTILLYRGEPSHTYALPAPRTPLIDGDSWDWTVSNVLTVTAHSADDVRGARPTGLSDISVKIRPWWDARDLYLFADVMDSDVRAGDKVMFVFDGLGNGAGGPDDLTLQVTAPMSGTQHMTGNATVAKRRTAEGWRAEVRIPAEVLGGGFTPDRDIRWTVMVVDRDATDTTTLIRDGRSTKPGPEFGHLVLLGNEVTLQRGLNAYGESVDCWISRAWGETNTNQCSRSQELARVFYVESNDGRAGLLKFDFLPLPAGVDVSSATLELYTTGTRGGHASLTIGAYPLLRDWLFDQVTWQNARGGDPWGQPGANDTTSDRWATPVGKAIVDDTNTWFRWDVTAAVRQWIDGRLANNGLIMKSIDAGNHPPYARFEFVGERNSVGMYEKKHPRLIIHYNVPAPQATATPTPEPTPTSTPTPEPTVPPVSTSSGIYLPLLLR